MKPWMRTAVAVVLVLAIAAGGFFLPNLVAVRLDRTDQDTAFSLSAGDEQGPATVLRRKLTDGMQNLFYGTEEPVELDESAAVHTLAEMTQYAQLLSLAILFAFFTDSAEKTSYPDFFSENVIPRFKFSSSSTTSIPGIASAPLFINYSS